MSNKLSPNISQLINSIFPDHISASYPRLVEFAKAFFDYLETENKSSYYQNTLHKQRDIREQEEMFLSYIQRELGLYTNKSYAADPKLFYDYISTLWKVKGSEEAIKTFFRIFLGDEVTVYYPWESVLIASDGRWTIDTVIRVSIISGNPDDFVGQTIKQLGSTGTAVVSQVLRGVYKDSDVYELYISSSSGSFLDHGIIYVEGNDDLRAEAYRSLSGINIVDGGSGYKVGDKITIKGYEGISFIAYVSFVDENGKILEIKIRDFGSGNTPNHIVQGENAPQYYFKDFLVYKNNPFLQANGYNDFFLSVRRDSITVYEFDEKLRLLDGIVGSTDHDYTTTTELYFAEDYVGESAFNNEASVSSTQTIESYNGIVGPTKPPITIETDSGEGAEFSLDFSVITSYPGYYKGVKGQLSESIVLQDSKYYQKFSYEVNTSHSPESWLNPLKKITHPAGIAVFGKIRSYDEEFVGIKDSYVFVREKTPPTYTITERPRIITTVIGTLQDYVYNNNTEESFSDELYFAEDYVGETKFSEDSVIAAQNTTDSVDGGSFSEIS